MEPQQRPPVELRPHWHDRLIHWSGWEQLSERRRPVLGALILILLCVWMIVWWVGRRSTTSVASALRAEALVQRLRSPKETPDLPSMTVKEERERLEALVPVKSALSPRFSGVLAEEEVVQRVQPITKDRFIVAIQNLRQASLPVDAAVTEATELTKEGKTVDALQTLDTVTQETAFPVVRAYALLQKAVLLRDQHVSNGEVIDELQTLLQSSSMVRDVVDQWFSGQGDRALTALRS